MNIKITNGYSIPSMSLVETYEFFQKYREKIRVLSKKLITERIGNMSMGYIDYNFLPEDRKELFSDMYKYFHIRDNMMQNPMFASYKKIQENEQRIIAEKIKKPEYDFLCDVIFFPMEGETLVMLFAQQKAYINAFEEMPGVTPYPYWTETQRPPEITKDEWNLRELKWRNAVGVTGIPSLDGFSVSCYGQMPFVDDSEVFTYINSRFDMNVRTNNYASKIITLRKYRELSNQEGFLSGSQDLYKSAMQYLKTPEGQIEFKKESEHLSKLFKENIVPEDLTTSFSDLVNMKK